MFAQKTEYFLLMVLSIRHQWLSYALNFGINSLHIGVQFNSLPHIDNYIRNEYTGNYYECDGNSNPRTTYGQVSPPSLSSSRCVISVAEFHCKFSAMN